jgi:hypothetical protein
MTKKRLALLAVLPFMIAVILGVLAMLPPRPGVTKARFNRIEKGMTQADVEEIFGQIAKGRAKGSDGVELEGIYYWTADDGSIAMVWIVGHVVNFKQWVPSNETTLDKIRRWLHLPKGDENA